MIAPLNIQRYLKLNSKGHFSWELDVKSNSKPNLLCTAWIAVSREFLEYAGSKNSVKQALNEKLSPHEALNSSIRNHQDILSAHFKTQIIFTKNNVFGKCLYFIQFLKT